MSTTRCVTTCPIRSLGPHDPTTAVELAALVLIKDKGAPAGQPIAAYAVYVREYNGSGPAADAYAARVLADAHAYQGAGTVASGPSCGAALGTPLVPGAKAKILPSGDAAAPADAPVVVQQMIAAGNRIDHFAYSFGGGHGDPAQTMNQSNPNPAAVPGAEENGGPGYDCSSATSYVLWGGGHGAEPARRWRPRVRRPRERRPARAGAVGDDLRRPPGTRTSRSRASTSTRPRGSATRPEPAGHRAAVEHRRDRARAGSSSAIHRGSERNGGRRHSFERVDRLVVDAREPEPFTLPGVGGPSANDTGSRS